MDGARCWMFKEKLEEEQERNIRGRFKELAGEENCDEEKEEEELASQLSAE